MIPFVDLKAQYNTIKPKIDSAISDIIENTCFIGGSPLTAFEQAFAEFQGTEYCVGCASGTAAIFLTLRALNIQPGDEIITTPHTFIATVEPIEEIGAIPVFVDIDPVTYNIDSAQIETAITDKTRVIMPVHLYGQLAPMDEIMAIAKRHNLFVIEDAAQAHGASYHHKRAGQWGDAAVFSFYPGKNLGAYGDAGGLCTNDATLAATVSKLRNHGRTEKYAHDVIGYGERMDTLQAAILNAKLPHLEEWNAKRREHAHYYTEQITNNLAGIIPPETQLDAEHVFHIYCVRVEGNRNVILSAIQEQGVGAGIHYPIPLHLQPALAHYNYKVGNFLHTEAAAANIISLPIYPELTQEQLDTVISSLQTALVAAHSH